MRNRSRSLSVFYRRKWFVRARKLVDFFAGLVLTTAEYIVDFIIWCCRQIGLVIVILWNRKKKTQAETVTKPVIVEERCSSTPLKPQETILRPFQTEALEILIAWGERKSEAIKLIVLTCQKHPEVNSAEVLIPLIYKLKEGAEV